VRRGAERAIIIQNRDPGEVAIATTEPRRSDALGIASAGTPNVIDIPDSEFDRQSAPRTSSRDEGDRAGRRVRPEPFTSELSATSPSRR
jgi:hypothetical protein